MVAMGVNHAPPPSVGIDVFKKLVRVPATAIKPDAASASQSSATTPRDRATGPARRTPR